MEQIARTLSMLLKSLHLFIGSLLVTRSLPMTTLSTTIKAVMVVCPTRRLIFIVDPKLLIYSRLDYLSQYPRSVPEGHEISITGGFLLATFFCIPIDMVMGRRTQLHVATSLEDKCNAH